MCLESFAVVAALWSLFIAELEPVSVVRGSRLDLQGDGGAGGDIREVR